MSDKAHRLTDEKLEEMERHLSAIYSRASKEIGKEWKRYIKEAGKEIEDLQEKYDLAKKGGDRDEIRKAGKTLGQAKRERTIMNKRFKDLSERTAMEISKVNETALAYINSELPEIYVTGYNALADAVDGVGGYAFNLLDANTVKNLALADESLLPYKKLDPAKDIPWNMKKINAEVLQGILQGESMDKIANRIGRVQQMNANASIRTARTIVTGAENKGRQDSYARAEVDGIILQKEWLATNDNRTRHSHVLLDGDIVDQDKEFDNGLMFPGDPNGEPSEVYNCRCSMTAVVKGFKK
jgi:SPP1 gp7 family putative phage head morphogenesis protein